MTTPRQLKPSFGPSDRDLLSQFVTKRDEASFRLLVTRHSAMVWSISRRILSSQQDREDVFQATFLKLLMHAERKTWHETLGGWLHQVAYRLSLKALAARTREQALESVDEPWSEDDCLEEIQRHDAELALHEAIAQLPTRDRQAIVLHYFQNKSREEAAQEMGCSLAAVKSLLQRGRRKLYLRLGCRGLSCYLALVSLEQTLTAATPELPDLIEKAVSVGLNYPVGSGAVPISPEVNSLCRGERVSMMPKSVVSNATVGIGGLMLFFLAGQGLPIEGWNPNLVAYGAPLLVSHLAVTAPPDTKGAEPEIRLSSRQARNLKLLRSASQELTSLATASQQAHEKLAETYRSMMAYNRHPQESQLDLEELDTTLLDLEKIFRVNSQQLRTAWSPLDEMAMTHDQNQPAERLKQNAFETAADSLHRVILIDQDIVRGLKDFKGKMPNFKPDDKGWDWEEDNLANLSKIFDSNRQVLETVTADLSDSPPAGQQAAIQDALNKLQESEQKTKPMHVAGDAVGRDQVGEISDKIHEKFREVRGLQIQGIMGDPRDPSGRRYSIIFVSASDRRRNLVLAELEKVPGLKILDANLPKFEFHGPECDLSDKIDVEFPPLMR